jgi:hypothetical protein
MSEQQFEQYLADLADHLDLSPYDRQRIRAELRAHLEDHLDALVCQGLPHEQAVQRALAEFGEVRGLGERFTRVHRRATWSRAIAGLAALLVVTLTWQTAWRALTGDAGMRGNPALVTAGALLMDQPEPEPPDQAEAALHRIVPQVELEDATLEETFDFLRKALDCNIWVNWPSLQQVGIDRQATISLVLHDVPADRLLEILCAEMSSHAPVSYGVADNVLEIAPLEALRAPPAGPGTELRLYDVGDLVRPSNRGSREDLRPSPDELMMVIARTVAPDEWDDHPNVTINIFDGQLIVRQTADNHAMIEHLIGELRARPRSSQAAAVAPQPEARSPEARKMAIIEVEAQLDQARVRLESMRQQLETKRSQAERGLIGPAEVPGVEADIRMLEIECRRLERQLDLLRARGEAPEPKEREGRSEFEHQLQLAELEAQREQAQVHLDQARRELQYKQELFEGNRIPQGEVEAAQAAVRTLEIEVERLSKQLEIIRQAHDEG